MAENQLTFNLDDSNVAATNTPPQGIGELPISRKLEKKFARLRDQWKAERGPESSTLRMVMHQAYQTIIGMGQAVIPLLLHELATGLHSWFWALRSITEADPVKPEERGDGGAMANAWLEWGRQQGYKW